LEPRARVVVADAFPIVLLGVSTVIEDDPRLQLVGKASTMAALLEKVIAEEPDIVLVDWWLASQDLKAMTALLQPDLHRTSLVVLTATENEQEKRAMLRLGVHVVVSKQTTPSELQAAVWQTWRDVTAIRNSAAEAG